jgi:glucosamine--fructose-6-phosphate aminotransferase (isomerizing)
MDDLRRRIAPRDPDAPLAAAPEPWDYLPAPATRPSAPWAMEEMIASEPALAARIARRIVDDGSAAALADAVRAAAASGGPVIVTGCGTSEHAAMGFAAILRDAWAEASLPGWGPIAIQAFELQLDPPPSGLVIGISHEGGTAATIGALKAARARGASTAVITASAGSPAAGAAAVVVATLEMDASWCHTVGYVSPLVAACVAADALTGRETSGDELHRRLADGIEAAWAPSPRGQPALEAGAAVAGRSHLLVVASGVDRVTARELVLKVEEAAWVPSAMRDLETFLHGHLPSTGADTALVLVLTEREALEARATRSRQALAAAGSLGVACVGILSADAAALVPPELTPEGRIVVPDPRALPAAASSLLGAAGPLQLLTLAVSAARGTNPDPIRRDQPAYLRAAELADDPSI